MFQLLICQASLLEQQEGIRFTEDELKFLYKLCALGVVPHRDISTVFEMLTYGLTSEQLLVRMKSILAYVKTYYIPLIVKDGSCFDDTAVFYNSSKHMYLQLRNLLGFKPEPTHLLGKF